MKEVVRVLEDYYSSADNYIVLDKPWFRTPTKLTDGIYTLEVMFNISESPDRHYYNIRSMGPYKFKWLCGTALTISRNDINIGLYGTSFSIDYVGKKYEYGGYITSLIEQEIIEKKYKPLYLEEDLVPSQFFGLNDYLKIRI